MYIDAHTHPQFPAYDSDRDEVLSRAREANVKMIAVGTTIGTSVDAIELAEKYPSEIRATAGVHPSQFNKEKYHDPNELRVPEQGVDFEKLRNLAGQKSVVAIGECGFDTYRIEQGESRESQAGLQRDGFIKQIEIANEVCKPLMIHCRSAFPELIDTLSAHNKLLSDPPGIIHFFSGTKSQAIKLLEMGFYFTFGGVLTFTSDYDEVVRMVPENRLLTETDAPYVSPAPNRGKRNEPAYVSLVVNRLAELKLHPIEELKEIIYENAQKLGLLTK